MPDNQKELFCPACGEKMKKVLLTESNINVDICANGCGGIYFDNRELEKVDEAHEHADEIIQEIDSKTFKSVDTTQQRVCPVCGTKMLKMGVAKGGIKIDVCATCGGKFLDAGELQAIRNIQQKDLDDKIKTKMATMYQDNLNQVTFGLRKFLNSKTLDELTKTISNTLGEK